MKTALFIFIASVMILACVCAYGYRAGKMAAESKMKDSIVENTIKTKYDTEKLKKELQELKKKIREAKNEDCEYILNYPVNKCLHD